MHNAGLYSVKTTSRVTWHFGVGLSLSVKDTHKLKSHTTLTRHRM